MRAVVLGASGHIGNALVRALLQHGASVTACGRRLDPLPANLENLDISPVSADRSVAADMEKVIDGHDLVIDAAAPYLTDTLAPWQMRPGQLSSGSDTGNVHSVVQESVRHTRQLLETVRRHKARYVYISSFTTNTGPVNRNSALAASYRRIVAPYFDLKQQLENAVRAASAAGLPVIIVKPSICIGPWEQRSEGFIPVLLQAPVVFTVTDQVNFIDVRDVAANVLTLVERGYFGATTRLCGHNARVDKLIEKVLVHREKMSPLQIPSLSGVNALAAYSAETLQRTIGLSPSFPALAALLLCESHPMQPSRLQLHLDLKLHSLDNSIHKAVDWTKYVTNRPITNH